MEFETPQKENKAMGIGQIHRSLTSMPTAPYWLQGGKVHLIRVAMTLVGLFGQLLQCLLLKQAKRYWLLLDHFKLIAWVAAFQRLINSEVS